MKEINFLLLCAAMLIITSCKKRENQFVPSGSINVVNAVIGGGNVKMEKSTGDSASVNSFKRFAIEAGNMPLKLYPTNSPSALYYNETRNIEVGNWYSLLLCGQSPNVEGIFMKDNLVSYKDSVVSVRFVNLSPNSTPVNVTLSTSTTVNQFAGIAYKQVANFKTFAAGPTATASMFNFQVRNSTTNAILANYLFTAANLTNSRFRNVTLVFRGMIGGTGTSAPGMIFVPHY